MQEKDEVQRTGAKLQLCQRKKFCVIIPQYNEYKNNCVLYIEEYKYDGF